MEFFFKLSALCTCGLETSIPGKGIGTPVVWGDQIFITSAIELDKKATEEAIKSGIQAERRER